LHVRKRKNGRMEKITNLIKKLVTYYYGHEMKWDIAETTRSKHGREEISTKF
jgi:hypothetical protein